MDVQNLPRRAFLRRTGLGLPVALAAAGVLRAAPPSPSSPPGVDPAAPGAIRPLVRELPPIRATRDRLIKENVGLRPFREGGPNLGVERVGEKTVVHNYGHGGSGWSLSWGTGMQARDRVLATGVREVAVIGCGAVGLTTAVLLQRAGLGVTIYTKARHPEITSTMATGVWSPDSRICLEERVDARLADWWETTCRDSFREFQHLLGLPGYPVEWVDGFAVSDRPWAELAAERAARPGPRFARFSDRVEDLTPRVVDLAPGEHPFAEPFVRRTARLVFNLPAYLDYLSREFSSVGGRVEWREFHRPEDFSALPQATLVNCTGLGARTLFNDRQMVPVWGQMSFLVPQPEVHYAFSNPWASALPRRDGIALSWHDNGRYGMEEASTDRAQSQLAIESIARSMAGMRTGA
jgi:hypothetical protein